MTKILTYIPSTAPAPTPAVQATAVDPLAQLRSELGWYSLLEVLVGEERARNMIIEAGAKDSDEI